jgi:hypothetical protein
MQYVKSSITVTTYSNPLITLLTVQRREGAMRLRMKMPAYLACVGLLLPGFVSAGAQKVAGPADSITRLAASPPKSSFDGLPDSPGAIYSRLQQTENWQSNLETQFGPSVPPKPQTGAPEAQPDSQTSVPSPQKPVGTAVAEPATVSGVAASQPAGMAIAPAKQRRVRTMVLRIGAIAGVGVAMGTVFALNRSTPSKPPGTR